MSTTVAPAFTLAGGSLIFAGVIVVIFLAVVFGHYTRRGSAINQHPYADLDHNSGRETPSELAHDITQDVRNWDRGVGAHHRHPHASTPVHLSDEALSAALHAWRTGSETGTLAQLDDSTPVRGPDTGVELIVFWDYLAPSASALASALTALQAMRPVREAALHLPLAHARPLSFLAAVAVEAARSQGEFWAAHDRLLTRPPNNERGVFAAAELVQDPERFRTEVEKRIGHERILRHIRLATASGVHTAPAVFIGGARYDGEHDPHELASAIDRPGAHRWQRRIPQPDAPGRGRLAS
jgi:hypothetical protein